MVSAIITTHNRCDLLMRAIQSVKEQTYKNIELIVVDDASDDNTRIICDRIKDIKYIRIEKSESRGGNYARNRGIKESNGEFIAFLDDDDEWYYNKIELQLELFNKDEEIGMIYTGMNIDTGIAVLNYKITYNKNAQGDILRKKLYWKPFCTTSTMIVRRNILNEVGFFDENLKYWQEYELTLRIIKCCRIALINIPLINYKKSIFDKKQLTNNYDKWEESVSYIYNKHQDIFNLLNEEEQKSKMETYYKEAAYRTSAIGDISLMKDYYKKAYELTGKKEYFIRWKLGVSRQKTILLEIIIKKIVYVIRK